MLIIQLLFVVVRFSLMAVMIAFLVRSLLSLIMPDADNGATRLSFIMSEVFIVPYRVLFNKKGWFQGFILDIAFFAGYVTVGLLSLVVTYFYENLFMF